MHIQFPSCKTNCSWYEICYNHTNSMLRWRKTIRFWMIGHLRNFYWHGMVGIPFQNLSNQIVLTMQRVSCFRFSLFYPVFWIATGGTLRNRFFLWAPTQLSSLEFCEIFKSTFFYRTSLVEKQQYYYKLMHIYRHNR